MCHFLSTLPRVDLILLVGNRNTLRPDTLEIMLKVLAKKELTSDQTLTLFAAREPPSGLSGGLTHRAYENQVAATMTYAIDSDIYFPYGMVLPKDSSQ